MLFNLNIRMAKVSPSMHVAKITKKANGKIYTSYDSALLGRTAKSNKTIANISNLPPEVIEQGAIFLERFPTATSRWSSVYFEILASIKLASTNCRDIILALIASRIINPLGPWPVRSEKGNSHHSLGMELNRSERLRDISRLVLARQNRSENKRLTEP